MGRHRPHVTVVGLGPAGTGYLTEEVRALLSGPGKRFLRTVLHPAAEGLEGFVAFDRVYETADTFGEVYATIVEELVAALRLRVIGEPHWHQFPSPSGSDDPGGVTGLYLLAESHLTCHTFPEHGRATFNLYCCRRQPAWDWQEFLERRIGAGEVVARSIPRGVHTADSLPVEECQQ